MSNHANYYTNLLRRRCAGDETLTSAQRQELDLHLMICLQCNFAYAKHVMQRSPQVGTKLLQVLEAKTTAIQVAPYLPALARAARTGRPLTEFETWLMRFVHRDTGTLGQFRLLQIDLRRLEAHAP